MGPMVENAVFHLHICKNIERTMYFQCCSVKKGVIILQSLIVYAQVIIIAFYTSSLSSLFSYNLILC